MNPSVPFKEMVLPPKFPLFKSFSAPGSTLQNPLKTGLVPLFKQLL